MKQQGNAKYRNEKKYVSMTCLWLSYNNLTTKINGGN